jgi:hypothetical protein
MPNDRERAEFWKEFILSKCRYPAIEKLRAQFERAEFYDFCDCGCNSFRVKLKSGDVPLLVAPGGSGSIYEANFRLIDHEGTLEIILLAGEDGNLNYVEVDYCANSFPVPETIDVEEPPFHVYASTKLLL